MDRRRLLLLIGAAGALSGCASRPSSVPAAVSPGAGPAELEALQSVLATRDGLTIRVASNGCTQKADFAFFVERQGQAVTVAFARRRLDRCMSFAAGHADLAFSYAELGLEPRVPVFVLNPLEGA